VPPPDGELTTQPPTSRLAGLWSTLRYLAAAFVIGVVAQVAEEIPGVAALNAAINRNASAIAWPAVMLLGVSTLAMIAGIFWPSGRKAGRRREPVGTFKLAAMKQAWATGAIRRERLWQKRSLLFGGGLGLAFAVFAMAFALVEPAFPKLLLGPALIYMAVRLGWGLYRL
jgi:hypothetical protein